MHIIYRFRQVAVPLDTHRYGSIRCLRTESVGPVVAHVDLVAQVELNLLWLHVVYVVGRLAGQQSEHLHLRRQLDLRDLDGLVFRRRLAKRLPLSGVFDRFLDAVRGRLTDAVFMHERLNTR